MSCWVYNTEANEFWFVNKQVGNYHTTGYDEFVTQRAEELRNYKLTIFEALFK